MSLIYNASFDSQTRVLSLLDKAGNVISSCEVPRKSNELTLTATVDNSSVKLIKNGTLSNTYEVNTGSGWAAYKFNTVIPLNAGESCKWRCSAHPTTQIGSNYVQFVMTGSIEASGNCNSMLLGGFENITSLSGYDYAFYKLFSGCRELTKAPDLPATTLEFGCYNNMFNGCTSLNSAPQLPATTLAVSCYDNMFNGCTSLNSAPQLPATTLAKSCYFSMFYGCTSLNSAPQLPATTLANYCYQRMFKDCTSLTSAPQLPATTLAESCYSSMFYGCTSLNSAPQLPATTLTKSCYNLMFCGCSKLKEVRISATTTATDSLKDWLYGVSATGDFYCDPNATIFPTYSVSGIPKNWNRWVYGAEDTETTITMYHNGAAETVRVGTSSYGACYALQGWVGFKSLAEMHSLGYTLGEQTVVTLYEDEHPMSVYACDVNDDDGFTETMYDIGDGKGYLTIERQNEKRYYVTPTPFTGLTLKATNDSFVTLESSGYIRNTYRVDTGYGWGDYTLGTEIYLRAGRICRWDCSNHPTTQDGSNYVQFVMTGNIEASGNCLSLLRKNFENVSTMPKYAFNNLFDACTALTKAPELPAMTLSEYCYYYMFYKCRSLTKAPALPATSLYSNCYGGMFFDCSNLKEVRVSAKGSLGNSVNSWLINVSSTGDFYCDPNTNFPSGKSGIPENWRRLNIADYPVTP